jgi:hypothetical protein
VELLVSTDSPLTMMDMIGRDRQKKQMLISYIPEARVNMLVLSLSHRKLSGRVFTLSDSHGTRHPARISPEFHSHLPMMFSEQSVSLIVA